MEPGRLERGVAELAALGFRVRVSEGARRRWRFTAGTAEERRRDLRTLLEDDEVAAIVAARGGAGAGWMMPDLPPELFRAHPKIVLGYSDLTFVHLQLNRANVVSLHGPMVGWELADRSYHRPSLLAGLMGQGAPYATEPDELMPLRPGVAEGRLRGGCLSILAAAAGTPWALTTEGEDTILFLEDVDERPYRVDRTLMQLRQTGALEGVRGIVFGDMNGCSPAMDAGYGLEDVLLQSLDGLAIPVALGLSSGHTRSPGVTLPLGVRARLECGAAEARFEVLEPAVS